MATTGKSASGVEQIGALTPSGVTPANGQEFGRGRSAVRDLQSQGLNLGDICSVEKGDCATVPRVPQPARPNVDPTVPRRRGA